MFVREGEVVRLNSKPRPDRQRATEAGIQHSRSVLE